MSAQPTETLFPEPSTYEIAYQSDFSTLWFGDCADVIDDLPRDSVHLIATDPPYGVKWQSNRRVKSPRFAPLLGDDGTLDVPAILGAATYALLNCRHVYVFGYSPEQLATPMRLSATADLIWDKGMLGMGDLTVPWAPSHEAITFGVHVTSPANRARGDGGLSARMRTRSVLRVPRGNSASVKRHPTEKPVPVMRQIVESSSLPGDVVFDPFAGSMSTIVAAILCGRIGWGVENDKQYIDPGIQRIKAAEEVAQRMLAA